jgi:hypothetical protein
MDKKPWIILAIGFTLGFFVGREQMRHEIAGAILGAAADFSAGLAKSLAGDASTTASSKELDKSPAAKEKEAATAYAKQHVLLYDLSSKMYESSLNGRVPGVDFKLRNNGNRSLKAVRVVAYFKDADGKRIAEETFYPVNDLSFSGPSGPLKPGYIWQQEKGHFYSAKQVPAEWAEGSVEAEILSAEFDS